MSNKKYDYKIGDIFGLMLVLDIFKNDKNITMASVKCIKCGKQKTMRGCDLHVKKQNSCKCMVRTHGMDGSRIYAIYHNMKYRCYTKTCNAFHNYGGNGIEVCDEWLESFDEFYKWAMNNGYSDNLTIDRIDSDGNYCPNNCQWITKSENTTRANIGRKGK
jgi:hypothetical protein